MARHAHGTLTTQAKHAAKIWACYAWPLPPASPGKDPEFPPAPGHCLQPFSCTDQQQLHWEAQTQCLIGPERGGNSLGAKRSHWKICVPGRCAFSFLLPSHDSLKLKLLWKDPSSTHIHRALTTALKS